MTLNNADIKETIRQAQFLLEQEPNVSNTFKSVFTLIITMMQLMLERLAIPATSEIDALKAEINRLQEELRLAQHRRFGKTSEVNIGEPIATNTNNILDTKTITVATHTRSIKKCGRNIDTSLLPRYKVFHDLENSQKSVHVAAVT